MIVNKSREHRMRKINGDNGDDKDGDDDTTTIINKQ